MEINGRFTPERESLGQHEDLVGNMVIDFGSNMLILGHPDVKGLHVRRNPQTNDVIVDIFVYRLTGALELLIQEEYGGHEVCIHDATLGPEITSSLS